MFLNFVFLTATHSDRVSTSCGSWNYGTPLHAVLGLIAVIFIQRAIHKILIFVLLTREFKHDKTNKAWWTGRRYGKNLGTPSLLSLVLVFGLLQVQEAYGAQGGACGRDGEGVVRLRGPWQVPTPCPLALFATI
jgi:hypothetical protein